MVRIKLGATNALCVDRVEIQSIRYTAFVFDQKSRLGSWLLAIKILIRHGQPTHPIAGLGDQVEHAVGLILLAQIGLIATAVFTLHHQLEFVLVGKNGFLGLLFLQV